MTLKEKIYAIKVATKLNAIVQDAIKNFDPIYLLRYSALKNEVANTCFKKNYSSKIYTTFFTKTLNEWVEESK